MPTDTSTPTPPKPIAALIAMVENQIERQNSMMVELEKAVARLDQSMLKQLDLDFLEWLYDHVSTEVITEARIHNI